MKEPHPFKDPRKPLIKDDLLRGRISQLRCKLQNKAISHETESETFPETPASANFNRNDNILEVNDRLGLSDAKRQFGEGMLQFLSIVFWNILNQYSKCLSSVIIIISILVLQVQWTIQKHTPNYGYQEIF